MQPSTSWKLKDCATRPPRLKSCDAGRVAGRHCLDANNYIIWVITPQNNQDARHKGGDNKIRNPKQTFMPILGTMKNEN